MTQEHPITPPPELAIKWANASPLQHSDEYWAYECFIAHHAARWGADHELEACCEWASQFNYDDYRYQDELRSLRRPKPLSLKERALAELSLLRGDANAHGLGFDAPAIRRALEALPDD
jgi:hypothetical protein